MKQFNSFILTLLFSLSVFADKGAVDVLVSKAGLPLENYTVRIGQKDYKTDSFGFVTLGLEEGDHILNIKDGESYKTIPFQVVATERTQLLVNIFDKEIVSDLTQPEELKKANKLVSSENGDLAIQLKSVNGEPISGARVYARGTQVNGTTNRKGFVKLSLPVGQQVISITHPKFSTQVVRNIAIQKGGVETRNVELTPSGLVLEDFVVLAPNLKGSIEALIEVRRKASDVADVMSAEQMAKTGDSDAAGSLKRVTGLTLKDGKYVYVRGMGERYSATLLNGVALPSPDPSRRVVPLDLFPVQFLDSMIIQKSYSPNQPGEFGGGVVQLQTKSIPKEFFFKAGISQTINSNDGNMLTYQGSSTDWLGVDDGRRKAPQGAVENPQLFANVTGHNTEQQVNETLPDFSFSTGNSWKMGASRLGFNLSGLYKDDINFQREERFRYEFSTGSALAEEDYIRDKTTKERTVGGIAGIGIELFKNHKINTNYINLRNTTDYVGILEGNAENGFGRETQLEFAARTLRTFMVQGESEIPQVNDIKFNWSFSESNARRDEPGRVRYITSPNTDGDFVVDPSLENSYERRFYDLQERATDRSIAVESHFPWFGKRKGNVQVGFSQTNKNRKSAMTRYDFDASGVPCQNLGAPLDQVFAECGDSFTFKSNTQPTDRYTASQEINAYFFKTKWPLLRSLELSSGMRFEDSTQQVDTLSPFEKDPIFTQLNTRDWLPGSSLTWKMNKKMQVRLAYSETISRPDLREMSSTRWQDFESGFDVLGNPNLKATIIEAYDARWEWYFGRRENLSFGVFYKDFTNPVESTFVVATDTSIGFINAQGANIYGAEVEFSKNLNFISKWLRNWSLSGNYAYIESAVNLGDVTAIDSFSNNRPLQGQSPYMVNLLLDYESERLNMNTGLAYNVYGKRIAFLGPDGNPDIYEQPFHQVDFVIRKKLGRTLSLQGKIKNLLDSEVRLEQDGQKWQAFRRGRIFTLGVGMEI